MRPIIPFVIALVLFLGTEMLLVYLGVVRVYFLFFVPVFVSSSFISLAPLLSFLIPLIFFFVENKENYRYEGRYETTWEESNIRPKHEVKYGGLVMIGPIPILFGKGLSGKILALLVVLMIILIISWIIFAK